MSNSNELVKVAVAESSVVIRSGLSAALRRLPSIKIQAVEVASTISLNDCMRMQKPDILIVNPYFGEFFNIDEFRQKYIENNVRIVALKCVYIDNMILSKYDTVISVFDDLDVIAERLNGLRLKDEDEDADGEQDVLSQREKEIVICVVKGMTNKEIAEQLFLSIHTVITHRKNISKKLQIHSVSGLTIYAIVNKLVELSDIKSL
jgi:DNA-binding CsgD family transcriptional regulator